MKRREFLFRTAAVTSGLAIGNRGWAQEALLETPLEARETWVNLAGRQAQLYTFNGQVPGPLINVRPGDTVRIPFTNSLPEMTNLHFHGLHVSPEEIADNSFLEVAPGESMTYELPLPANHPSGMFWYHPHMHGTVARQVSRGLAGVILVRGEFDNQPEVRETPEFLLVLQDFDLTAGGHVIDPRPMELTRGREGPLLTVNGERNPTIPMRPAGWTRLRLLNASVSRFYRLRLEGHPFTVTGSDGGLIASPFEADELLIVPGQRFDVFVKAQAAEGTFRLLNLPYNRFGTMGGPSTTLEVLATFQYEGIAGESWSMPANLNSIEPLPPPATRRTFRFEMGMGMGMGMSGGGFAINGRAFDPHRVDTRVALDAIEEWELINTSPMEHPFHIHTNPFQVVSPGGDAERIWRDVVLVPAFQTVRIRLRFSDYAGKAMYHCHILDHEDLGMMGIIEVVPSI